MLVVILGAAMTGSNGAASNDGCSGGVSSLAIGLGSVYA
jgi:hypothetical protein